MATIDIDFEWARGLDYEHRDGAIRQIGKRKERAPFEKAPGLYLTFAKLDGTPEACVDFARAWGLLTTPASSVAEESLEDWQRHIRKMKGLVSGLGVVRTQGSRRVRMTLTTVDVALLSGEEDSWDAKPALVLQPRTLLSAMLVQIAQSRASGASIHVCEQCQKWFEVGVGAKRALVTKFCSDRCRNRYHYEQRIGK